MAEFSENRHISNLINMSCKVIPKFGLIKPVNIRWTDVQEFCIFNFTIGKVNEPVYLKFDFPMIPIVKG